MRRYLFLPALALAVALLTACGGDGGGEDRAAGRVVEHNDADVTFAQGMIPHHRQAVEMAQMALDKAADPKVKDLAQRIADAQQPEIDQMQGWLDDWGVAAGDHTGMDGMGMMGSAEMDALGATSGPEFDRMFLEQMTLHHEGAVEMARTEIDSGQFAPAMQLAQRIIDAQEAEIEEMRGLLAG